MGTLSLLRPFFGIFLTVVTSPAAAAQDWMDPGEPQPVTALSFDAREFVDAFNAATDRPRLVVVFSPT